MFGRLSLYGRPQDGKRLRFRFLCRETLPVLVGSHSLESRGKWPMYSPLFSHLEATAELLFKDMSSDPVPTSCLPAMEWLCEQKTPSNHQAVFSELLLSPSLFYCFEIFLPPPYIRLQLCILLSDFPPNYEFQLFLRQSFRV